VGWTGYKVNFEIKPTIEDLCPNAEDAYDVIMVQGGGPNWGALYKWLVNDGGTEILEECVSRYGVGLYMDTSVWAWDHTLAFPFGPEGQLNSYRGFYNILAPFPDPNDSSENATKTLANNPLYQGPYQPVGPRFWGHWAARTHYNYYTQADITLHTGLVDPPIAFQPFTVGDDDDDPIPRNVTTIGGDIPFAPLAGRNSRPNRRRRRVLYTGVMHNNYLLGVDENGIKEFPGSPPPVTHMRFNMYQYVCGSGNPLLLSEES
jgi:hypothetical protein